MSVYGRLEMIEEQLNDLTQAISGLSARIAKLEEKHEPIDINDVVSEQADSIKRARTVLSAYRYLGKR